MLQKSSTGLALMVLVISIALYFVSIGFDAGLHAADDDRREEKVIEEQKFSGYGHGIRTYEYLASRYCYVGFSILLFLVSSYVVNILRKAPTTVTRVLQVIGLALLLVPLHQFWWIFSEKHLRSQETYWNEPIDSLMQTALPYEILCTVIIIILIVLQVVSVFSRYRMDRE